VVWQRETYNILLKCDDGRHIPLRRRGIAVHRPYARRSPLKLEGRKREVQWRTVAEKATSAVQQERQIYESVRTGKDVRMLVRVLPGRKLP
jgi:hypothetical protein